MLPNIDRSLAHLALTQGTFQLAHDLQPQLPAYYDRQFLLMLVSTLLDLASSILLNVGLLFVTASVAQMLRGSLLLFVTALAVLLFQKPLNRFHALGLLSCMVGCQGCKC